MILDRVVRENWPRRFPNRPVPTDKTIRHTYQKFHNHGCVTAEHQKWQYPSRQISEEQKVHICGSVLQNLEEGGNKHLRDYADEVGLGKATVYKILKEEGFKAYKPQNHQEFRDNDYISRMTYAEITSELINNNDLTLDNIFFTDECTFVLKHRPNRQHYQVWGRQNPHIVLDTNTQYQAKVNVWAGMYRGNIVGPFFINGNLNGPTFRELLQNQVVPTLYRLGMNVSKFKFYFYANYFTQI